MTDDDRLAELFRAAASDVRAPAPGFDHDDVLAVSRRITARRRSALVAGAFAVFAVVGVGAVVGLSDDPVTTSAAAPAAADRAADRASAEAERAAAAPGAAAERESAPEGDGAGGAAGGASGGGAADAAVPQLAGPPPVGVPLGPGSRDCADRQDPALRALLEQVLPEVTGAPAAASTDECRPGTQRFVTLEVQDGPARGLLGVEYLPPGTPPELPPGAVEARTASGGTVIVHSGVVPAGPTGGTGPPPFSGRLDEIAGYLAPRL